MMRDYIDRKAVKEHLMSYAGMFTDELGFAVSLEAVLRGIDFQPAADAVEVTRCKDCKHYHLFDDGVKECRHSGGLNEAYPDDFCSYGERKEDG